MPVCFFWREARGRGKGMTVWSLFPRNTRYFRPGRANFMLNYRVKNLDSLLKALRRERVWIDPKREGTTDYGRFAWIQDPEGNRIELWQPPKEKRARRRKASRKSRQTKRARAR
jgi:hypothetical protein